MLLHSKSTHREIAQCNVAVLRYMCAVKTDDIVITTKSLWLLTIYWHDSNASNFNVDVTVKFNRWHCTRTMTNDFINSMTKLTMRLTRVVKQQLCHGREVAKTHAMRIDLWDGITKLYNSFLFALLWHGAIDCAILSNQLYDLYKC